ncbi:MAG: MBL fold metallo-hydrolase [Treponemataceae bacterium]
MKKRKISLFVVVFAVIFAACCGAAIWGSLRITSETSRMRPDDSGEVVPSVFAVRHDYVNSWFIKGKDGWIAVDTGVETKKLIGQMRALSIDPSSVKALLLTHTDYDHAGAVKALPGASLFIGEAEEQMVNGKTARMFFTRNSPLPLHSLLADGEQLTLAGLPVTAYHIPGHTPGSTAYLIGDGFLFVGDEMSILDGRMGPFNAFFNMDSAQALRSQSKLRAIPGVKAVFTSHYGHSLDPSRLFSPAP